MTDRSAVDRVLAANRYLVLGTADEDGQPWVTPVFFAPLDPNRVCWVSSPDSRHSTVDVGRAEAAYFDADAAQVTLDEKDTTLQALNSRLPPDKRLSDDDLQPRGPLVAYRADLRHRYVLVRGGDPEHPNVVDMTVEV